MKNLNYNSKMEQAPIHKPLWKAALYTTISNLDNDENNSVASQREMLEEYMKLHPDMEFYDTYADNAYIGLLCERPEFMRMMKDIIAGKINCIIVKDLSYFSRNYMDFEIYLNRITTKYKVRFIALNNEVDTIKDVTYKYAFAN
ncbi:MAG: recombinase family protein [Clostridia bacterium]|nr:recombinase family protein [Clostridia bacterium]